MLIYSPSLQSSAEQSKQTNGVPAADLGVGIPQLFSSTACIDNIRDLSQSLQLCHSGLLEVRVVVEGVVE